MRVVLKTFAQELHRRKRDYTFILGLILVGITFGSIFMTFLDKHDKLLVLNQITAYFDSIRNNQLTYLVALKDILISNLVFILIIWILGLSIFGIPIILFLVFFRGFILGFAIASIVYKYKFWGAILSIIYMFPHHLCSVIILMILSYYSLNYGFNLCCAIFQKKTINFKNITNRYFRVLFLAIIGTIIISLYEVFIVPTIIKFLLVLL